MFGIHRLPAQSALISLFLMLFALGCDNKAPQKPQAATVPVTIAVVEQRDVPVQIKAIASVDPYVTVGIKTMISGEITTVNFKEGQDVNKGQLLFTIDRRPMEADLRRAEATLARDEATAANDRAQATRYAALMKEGVVAQEQADQMVTAANASDALVKADRAAVENAKVALQYAQVYAPISGRTGNLMVQLGNVVKANPDTPIVTINQISPIYVTFTIPEQYLGDVKRYMAQHSLTVKAEIPNDPKPALGTLTFIDNAVDRQTGTIKLKATFANADRRLWPGQFVNATLTLADQPNAITVPNEALQTGQQGQFVYVVRQDGIAEARNVTVARTIEGKSVIASGLQPGERVVTDGQLRIRSGESKVEVRPNAPSAAPAPGGQNAQQQPAPKQEARN
jgi:membrane fusion protein, multidrug efflux system